MPSACPSTRPALLMSCSRPAGSLNRTAMLEEEQPKGMLRRLAGFQ